MNYIELRKKAFERCVNEYGDRLFEGKKTVWLVTFEGLDMDQMCVMMRMPADVDEVLGKMPVSSYAHTAAQHRTGRSELLAFSCGLPENKTSRAVDDIGNLLPGFEDLS